MARKQKRNQKTIIDLNSAKQEADSRQEKREIRLVPRNTAQEEYIEYLNDANSRITFAIGPAGTGKTYLGVLKAIKLLKSNEVKKIIVTRPAVAVAGENHGFLPGDLNAKMEPWLLPIFDVFEEYYTKKEIALMVEVGTIEISPLMYMRGRTFKDSFILFDEAQNTTPEQMKMILTRLGNNTRIVITGDLEQTDHKKQNGLDDICARVSSKTNNKSMNVCRFNTNHVERDPIVKIVLGMYDDEE